jgi:hypothetical protein
VPSNFYPIRVSGTGAADYRADIATCGDTVRCGEQYEVETGNMVGPTRQGTNDLIALENCGYSFLSQNHVYLCDDGERLPNPQLVSVPIWNACADPLFTYDPSAGQCPAEVVAPGGGVWYTVHAFATIFVESMLGGGVQVRFIDITKCKGSTGGPSLDETGPLALPVRLVRIPEGD